MGNNFRDIAHRIKLSYEKSIPLEVRLRLFFGIFILILAIASLMVLLFTGALSHGEPDNVASVNREFEILNDKISRDFGLLSIKACELSENISTKINLYLKENNLKI